MICSGIQSKERGMGPAYFAATKQPRMALSYSGSTEPWFENLNKPREILFEKTDPSFPGAGR
jgi:hypothetical protein